MDPFDLRPACDPDSNIVADERRRPAASSNLGRP
jgi:hypothetical protein